MRVVATYFAGLITVILAVLGYAPGIHLPVWDKLLHFIGFSALCVAVFLMWEWGFWQNWGLTAVLLYTTSVLSECIQGLLPYKQFDVIDILVSVIDGEPGRGW